ncbi:E3 ubiquitin-protein ligase, putative [Plasmodium knowlesi strain H]|uniref:E3 ubiquitin-protein ligase, putative n=3 Tax=Plasmodium knowlesi TaxID=5850 RepID=A0A5K1UMX9_PLAKH|nr:E3 ubiquitin-protein ligase, putative [Plasmodium knowlesi strain H]OTN65982.1 putative Binding protein [Plasmodium knowlesi]CAA9987892.1 E3 ubiquitin-protein ligase, putative [Plasmodium knowlesi strain H]SBO22263.1 E3 ubiquitin-protein ligase, putative [Plasmodium knowlesi strain H]SBO28825.1 E3 ubiquitin-protein ligase, putative [Plasmodium knowlesi strain H]VVS77366.1 E3 ubiquitin-protein ligase, putative [Plasmodium knowlesi strain H]|eukprot:XP_002258890.1 Binding protein, putative [Plasmodium knowlesi strain H]
MNIIDEYDLDMYKNIVMSNNCKEEDIFCIFNMSSFMNTLCFIVFFIIFLWALTIISRYYTSYNIMKYLKDRKAIYMQNMSRYIDEIKMLCRSHVNDIIRIKKKITPKSVDKINLDICIHDNIQLVKNYLSSSASDTSDLYKYGVTFTFSCKNPVCVTLYWGVLLKEINQVIHDKMEARRKTTNGRSTVICIDNFKTFFKEGFSRSLQSKPSSDAMTYLLDKNKGSGLYSGEEDVGVENIFDSHHHNRDNLSTQQNTSFINFTSCLHKTPSSFYTCRENITYTMPSDESFCVADVLVQMEVEKNGYLDDIKEKLKKNKYEQQHSLDEKVLSSHMSDEKIRIPLTILINDAPPMDSLSTSSLYGNSCGGRGLGVSKTVSPPKGVGRKKTNGAHASTLVVLVDFKKMKEKYIPSIIKDICVFSENGTNTSVHKSKKKNEVFQFLDILDIYGHEEHDKECLICMTSYKDTLLMPCRHSSFCYDCMKSLRQEKCPICRCLFTSFIKFPLKNIDRGGDMP